MSAPRATPSSADVAMEVSSLSVGVGILTRVLFPFALSALVLVAPLVLVPLAGMLLAAPVLLPLWLARRVRRARSRRQDPLVLAGNEIRTVAAGGGAASQSHSISSAGLS